MKKQVVILLAVALMLPLMAEAEMQSGFYTSSTEQEINPYGEQRFGTIGAESMNTGSGYSSSAVNGSYGIGSSSISSGVEDYSCRTAKYFGATGRRSDDDDLTPDEGQEGETYQPGDPVSDESVIPIGDGWDVLLLLLLCAVGYAVSVYRKLHISEKVTKI
ncbi:MAG: hypothetical protein MJZ65_02895 [Paludibacteraceae bacterium]|nr:hypothetical protein [Paludibacteraceae bacterium]